LVAIKIDEKYIKRITLAIHSDMNHSHSTPDINEDDMEKKRKKVKIFHYKGKYRRINRIVEGFLNGCGGCFLSCICMEEFDQ
jgi:hypothetical protein